MQQQENSVQMQRIQMLQYEGKQVLLAASDYKEAKKWMDDYLFNNDYDLTQLANVEFDAEDGLYIKSIEDIQTDVPIFSTGERDALDCLTKGYDTDEEAYVFSLVNVNYSSYQFPANDVEEAIQMLQEGQFQQSALLEEGSYFKSFSCGEEERAVVNGVTVPYKEEFDLVQELTRQYPDGLVVTLEDECVKNLINYKNNENEEEFITLYGMIDAGESKMAGAYGILKAQLKLNPDEYEELYACDKTYWDSALSDLGWESGSNATSMMLATEESMKDARIESIVSPSLLNSLYIQDRPYHQIMKIIETNGIKDDNELMFVLNSEFLEEQPEWKRKLAEEQTREQVQKHFIKYTAPVHFEQKKMYDETREQAAKENGYLDAAEWNRDIQWTKDPSPQLAAKLQATSERWRELYMPYQKKSNDAFHELDRVKAAEQTRFIENFDRQAAKLVSEVKIIQRGGNGWAVRCKMDGEQQSGRTLSQKDADNVNRSRNLGPLAREMAVKYFSQDIVDAMQQQQARGMKR